MSTKNDNNNSGKHVPYWEPWGQGGYLWRSFVFLLGLAAICLVLAVTYTHYGRHNIGAPPYADSTLVGDSAVDPYEGIRDTSVVADWNDSIPGVEELPAPDNNYIPPVDSTAIVQNPEDSLSQIVGDQLIAFFNSKNLKADMASFARQFKQLYPGNGYEILYYNPTAGTMLLGVPKDKLIATADELPKRITGIDFRVATNEILKETSKPSDPGFATPKYDEYFRLIQAYDAWGITRGSKNVKVAIMDSYFDLTNPEIGTRYTDNIHIPTKTRNVLPPAAMPKNEDELISYCHGSHVAGIAIGEQNNKIGCSGIAPGCSWIPVALGSQLTQFNMMEGILYAVYHGADVVNFSMGRSFPEEAKSIPIGDQIEIATTTDKRGEAMWQYIIKTANDHNCVLVTSAGNETVLMGLDPKNRDNDMIKVEAVDSKGIMASFSNYGKVPEANLSYSTVAAPGVALWSVIDKRCVPIWQRLSKGKIAGDAKLGLLEMDGTSMAAPVVAGAVALLKSKNKNLTTQQVINILTSTAKQTDTKHRIGPTIQLKDALDATGGEALNFDDLMKDHNLLLGKWKSTHELNIVDAETNKFHEHMWTYFIFTSTTSGTIEMHGISSKRIYRAPLKVTWGNNSISIIQLRDAVSADGSPMLKDVYVCRPNKQRLLETSCIRNGKERYTFLMEKVN